MSRNSGSSRLACVVLGVTLLLCHAGVSVAADTPEPDEWTWRFIAGGPMVGWPATDGFGNFYFTAEDRYLYSLDREGIMSWRTDLGRRSTGMVAVGADGSVYVVLEDGRMLALNKDGRLLWEVSLARGGHLPPVLLTSGVVVSSDRDGRVVAHTHAGSRVWELDLAESVACAPVVDYQRQIVFGTVGGNLVTVDASGTVVGRRYISYVPSAIAPHPDGLLVGTTSGHLLDLGHDGEPRWRVDLGSAVADLVVGQDRSAYARLDDGSLARVSVSGVATWRANPAPATVQSVIAADGAILAISGGSLAHIRPDGTLGWQVRTPTDPLHIAETGWGALVVSGQNWVSYSYPMQIEPGAAWPSVRGTPQAAGLPPGIPVTRPERRSYLDSFDFIYLSEFLRSSSENDQMKGLREILGRISPPDESSVGRQAVAADLAGSYPYILDLCEEIAGGPYYGPVGFQGRALASRNARSLALTILGQVGDLGSGRFLLRLLRVEEASDMQVEILDALARLGTGGQGEVVRTIAQTIAADIARGPSDRLALAAISCLEAVHEYEGGFLSADGVILLTDIVIGPYDRAVREAATAALASISSD